MSTISVGQYFSFTSRSRYGLGGYPKLCTKVSKGRVYFRRQHLDGQIDPMDKEEYCSLSSVGFIADTSAEIMAIYQLGKLKDDEIHAAIGQIDLKYEDKLRELRATFQKATT